MEPQSRIVLAFILVACAVIVGVQVFATWQASHRVESIVEEIRSLDAARLPEEKARDEIAQLKIENQLDRFFWQSLVAGLVPLASVAVALFGAWMGLQKYLDARRKERLDRAAGDLTQVLEYLADEDARKRTVGLVGLQHFFSDEKRDYHLRALAALATGARLERDAEVLRALRLAMEQAALHVAPELLREVSWQSVKLSGAGLAQRDLKGLDLRDAILEDADLSGAVLAGARMSAARLNGSNLTGADLRKADLAFADLAGACLAGADLRGAVLRDAKVLRLDLRGADLRGAELDPEEMRWDLIDHWREATFDDGLKERLVARYGPESSGPRVLMLLWEAPPLVAGGTWTAAYHLVRNLQRRGARVTVAVPWSESALSPLPFETDVELVSMDIEPPRRPSDSGQAPYWSPYGQPAWSPYGQPPWSPYGQPAWSPYGQPTWSPYGQPTWSPYGQPAWSPYAWLGSQPAPAGRFGGPTYGVYGASPYQTVQHGLSGSVYRGGSGLLRLMEIFRRRVARYAAKEGFEIVHAHDWVTFPAAREAARAAGVPWVGHFHSTEAERHPGRPDLVVESLEREAARDADALVAPSRITAARIAERYGTDPERPRVVPNVLSAEEIPTMDMGSFEAKQVVFLGRLASQKGPDLFARIASEVVRARPDVAFLAYGEGEEQDSLAGSPVQLRGPLDWPERGGAFGGASAVIVPSRAEPFGMVILEAMQHRVPVLFAAGCGAGEVLESGLPIDPERPAEVASRLIPLLDDALLWERSVQSQTREIAGYPERGYEQQMIELWDRVLAPANA